MRDSTLSVFLEVELVLVELVDPPAPVAERFQVDDLLGHGVVDSQPTSVIENREFRIRLVHIEVMLGPADPCVRDPRFSQLDDGGSLAVGRSHQFGGKVERTA